MTRSAWIRTLVAWCFALAALLGWWGLNDNVQVTGARSATAPLADAIPLDRVDEVTIEHADGRRLRFVRTTVGWQQVEPFPVGLDAYSVRQIASTAQGLSVVDTIAVEAPDAAARLGLDPPVATVTWRWPDGEQVVALGNRTLAGRAWARLDDETERAALVDASLHAKVLETDPRFLRDRTLAPFAGTETTRVLVRTAAEQLALERTDRGWMLTDPVRTF